MSLSIEVFLGQWWLWEGWVGNERKLAARGHPGRIENRRSSSVNRLRLVTNSRRGDEARARWVRRWVGLQRGRVEGRSWESRRNRCGGRSRLQMSGGMVSSSSVGPGVRAGTLRNTLNTQNFHNSEGTVIWSHLSQCLLPPPAAPTPL